MSFLQKALSEPHSPWLVFTSAGDQSNLGHWLSPRKNYDLCIAYYGDMPGRYREYSDYYVERKGSKFQNLSALHQQQNDLLGQYEAVFVLDDDIIFTGRDIERLFQLRSYYDLWIVQPGFSLDGKVSHPHTAAQQKSHFRYTNFVELGCPLFKTEKLTDFLSVYDSTLLGFGIDWWYHHHLKTKRKDRFAISDRYICLNPTEESKGGIREMDRLMSQIDRENNWITMLKQRGLTEFPMKEFKKVRYALSFRIWATLNSLKHKMQHSGR